MRKDSVSRYAVWEAQLRRSQVRALRRDHTAIETQAESQQHGGHITGVVRNIQFQCIHANVWIW